MAKIRDEKAEQFDHFLKFVRRIENEQPFERGVRHTLLRSLARQLGLLSDLVEWLKDGCFDDAEAELALRFELARQPLRQLDELLSTPIQTPEMLKDHVFEAQLSLVLDQILTASADRLPTEIHTQSLRVGVLWDEIDQQHQLWLETRKRVLAIRHVYELAVADLTFTSERGTGIEHVRGEYETVMTMVEAELATLEETELACKTLQKSLFALQEQTYPLFEQARTILHRFASLRAAFTTLKRTFPETHDRQMKDLEVRLQTILEQSRECFSDPVLPHRDVTLITAIETIHATRLRAKSVLVPSLQSRFKESLDRHEQVRRLALITLFVYTNPQDKKLHHARRNGVANKTIQEVLTIAKLIDESESSLASDYLSECTKDAALAELIHWRNTWWIYRISPTGITQALAWLADMKHPKDVLDLIKDSISERQLLVRQRQKKKSA